MSARSSSRTCSSKPSSRRGNVASDTSGSVVTVDSQHVVARLAVPDVHQRPADGFVVALVEYVVRAERYAPVGTDVEPHAQVDGCVAGLDEVEGRAAASVTVGEDAIHRFALRMQAATDSPAIEYAAQPLARPELQQVPWSLP